MNYDNRIFRPVQTTDNGAVDTETRFHYQQTENVLTCTYASRAILIVHLLGRVAENGCITMRYHQIDREGNLMTGECQSVPEMLPSGKIRLHESWRWTSGDGSSGSSVLEEI